jgi:arylsulfatase A-like enzyme
MKSICLSLKIMPIFSFVWAFVSLGMTLTNSFCSVAASEEVTSESEKRLPNIVYIMSDELAYYELSHMGNPYIRTPNIDRMAKEGIRFTNAYAAAPVCAPLRAALMTGLHMGHCSVRSNGGGTPLRATDRTFASNLKLKNYATGGFGKWGAGGRDSTGVPEKHGFDVFFGYYDQVHAHSFFPPYLIRNSEEVKLAGNVGGRSGETYSHYEIMREGLQFIRDHQEEPFLAYFPITPPHGMYDIPADDPAWEQYQNDAWVKDDSIQQDVKNYAAMVTMIDNDLQEILDLLKELNLEDNTMVLFTGDNGGQDRFRSKENPRGFFGPNVNPKTGVEFRGGKGSLYEGGLKIPFIVRWPGKIAPNQINDTVFSQVSMYATFQELAGTKPVGNPDGPSILPTLLGEEAVGRKQQQYDFLYWEYGSQIAVRKNNWKAIQPKKNQPWELYDLSKDVSETNDVAAEHPDVVAELKQHAMDSHTPVEFGTYTTTTRHEADRQAKWGSTRPPAKKRPKGAKLNRIQDKNLVPVADMSLVRCSSENRPNDRMAVHAIDGKSFTVWHSKFSGGLAKHPHELVIDLGEEKEVTGFRYLARQDTGWNGAFGETEFTLGNSSDDFGEAHLKTTFAKERTAQAADLPRPVRGRYVRIKILSEVNGGPWASAADIGVLAK